MSPDKSSDEVVDVNEAYTQEKSKKATKVSNEAVVVIRELLSLNDNLTLRQSLIKIGKKFQVIGDSKFCILHLQYAIKVLPIRHRMMCYHCHIDPWLIPCLALCILS